MTRRSFSVTALICIRLKDICATMHLSISILNKTKLHIHDYHNPMQVCLSEFMGLRKGTGVIYLQSDQTTTPLNLTWSADRYGYRSSSKLVTLVHTPLHCPQPVEHSSPCFQQEHCLVLHPILQLHLTTSKRSEAAASISVVTGRYFASFSYHPQSSGFSWSPCPIHCCTCR